MSALGLTVVLGMIVGAGMLFVVLGARRAPVRLRDALALLDGPRSEEPPSNSAAVRGLEGVGARFQQQLRLPVTARQRQLLRMSGRSVADLFAEKLVLLVTGLLAPGMWLLVQMLLGGQVSPVPLLAGPLLALGGYFLADLRLVRGSAQLNRSTTEAVHTFFDLVALERLANASATQAVTSAAEVSQTPLFRRISAGLERCRMEQVTPWRELHRVAREWDLPELADFADVMRLEEQGAALADTLQARVRELREAHHAEHRAQTQRETEGLTLWMTIPALLLGLAFIIPPLFMLVGPR